MSTDIIPVLLCGGSGTRLWPLSRKSYPKQFAAFLGDKSLFQSSALRLSGDGFEAPLVVTNADYRFIVTEQLAAVELGAQSILIEPDGRNTAPAILAAALRLAETNPDAMMLVAPSDHVISDPEAFRAAVQSGVSAAREGKLVTFGITPDRPETGYGYLEQGEPRADGTVGLTRFVEKPELAQAQDMLKTGGFLWNAGIFMFTVPAILEAFGTHAPDMLEAVRSALSGAKTDLGFTKLDAAGWEKAEADSIDYVVMEKADNLVVIPYSDGWSDLGDWDAVWRDGEKDSAGNAVWGCATPLDCENSLLRAEQDSLEVVGLGLKDTVVVAMSDAVLVADKSRAQDVKKAVAQLKSKSAPQAERLPRDYRPWGWFEGLAISDKFQVKRIVVNPGGRLSLQSHKCRSEHWIVVSGVAHVTIGEESKDVPENHSVYIPLGVKHRMENLTDEPMVLIEVQTGTYFGEDDIVRYEDVYARE